MKTKLAYISMLCGICIILIGFVNLSIHFLNLHKSKYDSYRTIKHSANYRKWEFNDINPIFEKNIDSQDP